MVCRVGGGLTEILTFSRYFSFPRLYINNDRSLKRAYVSSEVAILN